MWREVFWTWLLLVCGGAGTAGVATSTKGDVQSPCPDLFQYRMDDHRMLFGVMRIPPPQANIVQIVLELSVGNAVEGYNGNIELAYSKERVIEEIMRHQPILYRVNFPIWRHIPPQVTAIQVNGRLVCSGPKIAINLVQVLTTINLQHTLRINLAPLGATDPTTSDFDFGNVQNNINFKPQQPPTTTAGDFAHNPFIAVLNRTESSQPGPTIQRPTTAPPPLPGFVDRLKPQGGDVIPPPPQKLPAQPPNDELCGRPVATNSLIVEGSEVPKGAFPWLTAIFRVSSSGTGLQYICSGSLVSHRHVVTAAHCVYLEKTRRVVRAADLIFILGKQNIGKWAPSPGERMIEGDSVHPHPQYTQASSDADIAVVRLAEGVGPFTTLIRPVCLWGGQTALSDVVGRRGVVAGWGRTEDGAASAPLPRQTTLPIVDQETCLRSSHQFSHITSNRTFCAGFRNGSGPCNGDSGSGLILERRGVFYLRGIVSMSVSEAFTRTCDLSHYVVFTDAAKFTEWIVSFFSLPD